MKNAVLALSAIVSLAAVAAPTPPEKLRILPLDADPGEPKGAWTSVVYRDSTFRMPYATNVLDRLGFRFDVERFVPSGVRLHGVGYSLSGILEVPEAGEYEFRLETFPDDVCAARLMVNGRYVDERAGRLALGRGEARVDVWMKGMSRREVEEAGKRSLREIIHRRVTWRRAGGGDFAYAVVKPAPAPEYPAPFDRVFDLAGGRHENFGWRTFDFEVPEDGLYEVGLRTVMNESPQLTLCLDELELMTSSIRRNNDSRRGFAGNPVTNVLHRTFRAGWHGEVASRRFLKKGVHKLEVRSSLGRSWEDNLPRASSNRNVEVGWRKLPGVNPSTETAIWLEGRDSLVFAKGEPLVLEAQNPVKDAKSRWSFEVRKLETGDDGAGEPVFRRDYEVGGERVRFVYPNDREGVYEYLVRNDRGWITEGPWQFVTVDPTPEKPPRIGAKGVERHALAALYAKAPVDAVDFGTEPKGGEHLIRDWKGSPSFVVTNGTLVYRVTGTQGHTIRRGYPVKGSKTGEFTLTPPDGRKGGGRILHQEGWFAFTMKVPHPGRGYVLRAWIPNDADRVVPLYGVDRVTGAINGWTLHAGGDVPAAGKASPMHFMVWPNADRIDFMTFNATYDRQDKQGAIVRAELFECPETGLPPLPEAAGGWQAGRDLYWAGEQMDLGVNERTMPPLRGFMKSWIMPQESYGSVYRDWRDFLVSWNRQGNLSAATGNNLHFASVSTYSMRGYRGRAERIAIGGNDPYAGSVFAEDRDPFERDVFALMLEVSAKYGQRIACDFMLDWIYENVAKVWADAAGVPADGVTMTVNGREPAKVWGGIGLNPAHPVVRKRMIDFSEAIGARYGKYAAFAGVRRRFWPVCCPNFEPWFVNADFGYDDWTVGAFAKERGVADPALAAVGADAKAWAARRDRLRTEHEGEWFGWRTEKCLSLQREMLAALRRGAGRTDLVAYQDDPELGTERSPWRRDKGLDPAVFVKHPELGCVPGQVHVNGCGCEFNNLDGFCYGNFNARPAPYANADHGTNHWRVGAYPEGLCCNSSYRSHPYQLEKPAKALAGNRLRRICAGGEWCLPPPDPGLADFVQIWRAIPVLDYRCDFGGTNAAAAVWSARTEAGLVFFAVNPTDVPVEVTVALESRSPRVTDLVSGETAASAKEVKFRLEPFMPAVYRATGGNSVASVDAVRDRAALEGRPKYYPAPKPRRGGLHENVEAIRTKKGMQLTIFTPYEEFRLENRRIHPSRPELTVPVAYLKTGVEFKARYSGANPPEKIVYEGLFGGGFGPVEVLHGGESAGTLRGDDTGEPHFETLELAVPPELAKKIARDRMISLVGRGPKGLGALKLEVKLENSTKE